MTVKRNVLADEQLTVSNTDKSLTANVYNANSAGGTSQREYAFAAGHKSDYAVLEVLSESIYYTYDGSSPSSTNGHRLNAGDTLVLDSYAKIVALKMQRQGATDASVYITYYKG